MSKCLKEKVRCILYSSVIFNVILLLVLGGLLYYKNTRKDKDPVNSKGTLNSQVQLPGHSGVCILCDYLGKDITAKDTLFDRIETVKDGHRICCTTKPSFMPKLIGKVTIYIAGADPGFEVRGRGDVLKKITPSGGANIFGGISCEKSRFYAKKSYFFQF